MRLGRIWVGCFALLCLCTLPQNAPAQQLRAAVLRPMHRDNQEAIRLTHELVRYLAKGTDWKVFPVPDPKELAGAGQFAVISGGDSPAAAATVGRILKANKVVSGIVKNFGETVLMRFALTDVLSAETESSFKYVGSADGIDEALKAAAAKLLGKPLPRTYESLARREKAIKLVTEGIRLEASGSLEQAVRAYEDALELDEKNAEARSRLGELRIRMAFAEQREKKIQELYDKYLAETRELIAENKHEDALEPYGKVRAILINRGEKNVAKRFAEEKWYRELMDKLKALAAGHESRGEWLEAYGIFSYLLMDNPESAEYKEAIKRCDLNYALENRYGKKLFREQSQKRLTPGLFDKILAKTIRSYDGTIDYRKAATEAFANVELLAKNNKMREYWPQLAKTDRVEEFLTALNAMKEAVKVASEVDAKDLRKTLREVINLNRESVAIPDGLIVTEFIYGFTGVLDKHSNFFSELIYRTFVENARGSFAGIGVQITTRDGWLTVVVPLDDHPAIKVGVRAGDRISKINGEKAYKMPLEEAVLKLRGKKGTPVTITVIHRDDPNPKNPTEEDITIIRDIIKTDSVVGCAWNAREKKWSYMLSPNYGIGYIRIKNFQESTPDETARILDELAKRRLNGLVIDLRYNSGGLMLAAVRLSDMFLADGVIVSSSGRMYPRAESLAYDDERKTEKIPVVVLVNGSSASASEILAAALRENNRALVVGVRSFGKGSVQQMFDFPTGPKTMVGLKLTVAKYYTPSGLSIDGKGIEVDYEVALSNAESNALLRDLRTKRYGDLIEEPIKGKEKESRIIFEIPKKQFIDRQLEMARYLLRSKLLGFSVTPASKPAGKKAA